MELAKASWASRIPWIFDPFLGEKPTGDQLISVRVLKRLVARFLVGIGLTHPVIESRIKNLPWIRVGI